MKSLPNKRSLRLKTWDVEGPLDSYVGLSLAALVLHKLNFPGGGYAREMQPSEADATASDAGR